MTERKYNPSEKQLGAAKMARIPIKVETQQTRLPKPKWIRVKIPTGDRINKIKKMIREKSLYTVCEEASCPNLPECFSNGTATFMIMGDKCTRRCTFCNVGHGRPDPLDQNEPVHLAETVEKMGLRYVVITSVDRDDLRDGGANHFADCIHAIRKKVPAIKIEILVPDFRGRLEKALNNLAQHLPDVFNHNIETAPRLYKAVRPGSDYAWSLRLLQEFKKQHPQLPTKSGMMLGLGETDEEIEQALADLRAHDVNMLTLGQYLQPTPHHSPVDRFVTPERFQYFGDVAKKMGFSNVASGPLVRSSYHADQQAAGEEVS